MINSYECTSHICLEAAITQYKICDDTPVRVCLFGKQFYCNLSPIQDEKLKEILAQVGSDFERVQRNIFFNFVHTFRPIKASESHEDNDHLVNDILGFVAAALNCRLEFSDMTQLIVEKAEDSSFGLINCRLEFSDMIQLIVKKAEDRSFSPPRRAYELDIEMTDRVLKALDQTSLLKFQQYLSPDPEGEYFEIHVGQSRELRFSRENSKRCTIL